MCDIQLVHDPPLDLRALAALDALVRNESVSRAARELGVSQPTMSRTLSRLRATLGDALLVRSGNRMVPTPRARAIAKAAREAMRSLDNAVRRVHFSAPDSTRRFRIAAWDYTQRLLLPPLLRRLQTEAPHASVEVCPVEKRSPVEALERGDIDLSIGLHRDLREDYRRRALFDDHFALCARADHSLWQQPVTVERFASAPQLLVAPFGATRAGVVDIALRRLGLERRVALFVPSFAIAPDVLRETELIATLPARFVQHVAPDLRVEPVPLPLPEFAVEAVWHGSSHDDEGHRWLRQQLAVVADGLGAVD